MKTNYQLLLDKIIEDNSKLNKIPKLLMHSCCGPCSSYPIEYLSNYFSITIYYYNPNIFPYSEFERRSIEQQKLINELKTKYPINFVLEAYNNDEYEEYIKGHQSDLEGGIRCFKCYNLRMKKAAIYAKTNNFDYFTTTLSVSPYKNSEKINEIGILLEQEIGIKYLYADFKKKEGYKRSIELSKQYNLYRQDYCGCKYSMKDGD